MSSDEVPSIYELLDQTDIWFGRVSGDLIQYRVSEMSRNHLVNLRNKLLEMAQALHGDLIRSLWSIPAPEGEMAADDLDRSIAWLEGQSPTEWMRGQPLFEEIERKLAADPFADATDRDFLVAAHPAPVPQCQMHQRLTSPPVKLELSPEELDMVLDGLSELAQMGTSDSYVDPLSAEERDRVERLLLKLEEAL